MVSRRLPALLVAVALCSAITQGQIPGLGAGETEVAAEVPASLESPRATITTFLTAMNESDMAAARSTLDLSEIPRVLRSEEGARLATALWDVINRTRFVVLERVPSDPDGEAYVFSDYENQLEIVISKSSDGAWRFSKQTISQIDEISSYVREQGWEVKPNPETGEILAEIDLMQVNPAQWLKERVPETWRAKYIGLELYNYLGVLALLFVAFLAGAIIRWVTRLIVRSSLRINEEIADKKALKSLGRSISMIVNVAMITAGLPFLELPYFVLRPSMFILKFLGAFAWIWFLSRAWDIFVAAVAQRASERKRSTHKVVVPVVSKFGRFFIFVGVTVMFVSQLGYNVSALLAGLGIGGLVFALAAKDSVENLFGSITILMEMPFGVGDWVRIGDIDGEVEEINLRSTRIRTFKDSLITMPNSRMISSHVENFGLRRRRRIRTTLGIAYDTPPEKIALFCERIRDMLHEHPHIWDQKRFVYFNDLGDSTLNIMLYCFIEAPNWQLELEYRDDVLRRILTIANDMGVEFAFPTRTIIHSGELAHGATD